MAAIDGNTLHVGVVKTLQHAKRLCQEQHGRLPRVGYEFPIDSAPDSHQTYLANESGGYRVWTYIVPKPRPRT